MAEKEERIVCCIVENGNGCNYCLSKDGYQYRQCSISNYDCMHDRYGRCNLGMTRRNAIKKIEKHLIASTIKFNTTADVVAEIALNGLLEDK